MKRTATHGGLLAALLLAMAAAPASTAQPQQAESMIIDNGTVQTIVYNNGNIGGNCSGTHVGFAYLDDPGNQLCGAGFLLGINDSTVIGEPYILTNRTGWEPGTIGASTAFPYPALEGGVEATFSDTEGLGASVVLNAYFSSEAPNHEFVVFEYRITNTGETALEGVHPGLFVDWDLGPFDSENWASNMALVVEEEALMYVYDPIGGTENYFGQAALSAPLSGWEYFIDYPPVSGRPHNKAEMWAALTTRGLDSAPPQDQRSIIGTGPYDIPAGGSLTVAFALLASTSEAGIVENAQQARSAATVAAEQTTPAGRFVLESAFPNPAQASATIRFSLPEAQHVRLAVYDVLGRLVATLADEVRAGGEHPVRLDASGLPAGTYLVRLEAGSVRLTERLTVVR